MKLEKWTSLVSQLLAILIITTNVRAFPNCEYSSRCQSCSTNSPYTTCDTCYTFAASFNGNKVGDSSSATTCSTNMPETIKVANCKVYWAYSPSELYIGITVPTTSRPLCKICNDKLFLTYDESTNIESCTDTAITLSGSASCTEIENCQQTVCYKGASQGYAWCSLCNYQFAPSGIIQMDSASQYRAGSCIEANNLIQNCYWYEVSGTSTTAKCTMCQDAYVANFAGTQCVKMNSYTYYCAVLVDGSEAECYSCWTGYIFKNDVCWNWSGFVAGVGVFGLVLLGYLFD